MREKCVRKVCFVCFIFCFCVVCMAVVSCSLCSFERKIVLEIPKHPWENCSVNAKMWYSLKWSYGNEIKSLYVGPDEREVEIKIPIGETVFVCAFPLGEMKPFGYVITPQERLSTFELTQDDGFWAALFLDLDRDVTKEVNYKALKIAVDEVLQEVLLDFSKQSLADTSSSNHTSSSFLRASIRNLDKVVFLRDVFNGELSKSSIEFLSPFIIPSFAVSNGVWVSELVLGPCYTVTNSIMPELILSEGVHRFYNPTTNRELVVVVDDRGNVFRYIRQALV